MSIMNKLFVAMVLALVAGFASAEPLKGEENCGYFASFAAQVAMARDNGVPSQAEIQAKVEESIERSKTAPPEMTWAAPADGPMLRAAVKAIFASKKNPIDIADQMFRACMSRK